MKLKEFKHTNFDDEIEHGYHNDKPDWFLYAASAFLIIFGLVALSTLA